MNPMVWVEGVVTGAMYGVLVGGTIV